MKFKVLYNPLAGSNNQLGLEITLPSLMPDHEFYYQDITKVNYDDFFATLDFTTSILLCGGDGTINRFINDTAGYKFTNSVWYFASGNGNDFAKDIGLTPGDKPVCIDQYLKNLPTVTVKGKDYKFINGVGYGIDGYCCEVADKLKTENKEVNYTSIAIKGLLFHFKAKKATVIVDGKMKYTFKNTWIAPTMLGRYYGGGMIPTPEQDRLGEDISICVMFGAGRLGTLMTFPKIFKGEHVKKKNTVKVLTGKEIIVKFDKPCALQIDGETILDVSEYRAVSSSYVSLQDIIDEAAPAEA